MTRRAQRSSTLAAWPTPMQLDTAMPTPPETSNRPGPVRWTGPWASCMPCPARHWWAEPTISSSKNQ
eukprot:5906662-Pyramimonas_sp.AAC.1